MDGGAAIPIPDTALATLAGDLARLETTVESWAEEPRETARAYRQAIDALHAEALRRLIRTLRGSPDAAAALREAAGDDVVYAVLRHHGIVKPSLQERIEAALDSVRPMLAGHGGNVELVRIDPPAIAVRLTGACDNCPASTLTMDAAVRKAVQAACPEITEIVQVKNASCGTDAGRPREGAGWHPAGTLQGMADGAVRAMKLGDRAVILFRRGDTVTCYDDACAHLGAALRDGVVEDAVIECPWHGFRYDLLTGACLTAPGIALTAHTVEVVDGRVLVRLAG